MMSPPHSPTFEQAMQEIAALRTRLAEAERIRDSHWQRICKILPPIPPDYDFQEADLPMLLAESTSADDVLAEISRDDAL